MTPMQHDELTSLDQTMQRLESGWYTPHGDDDEGFDYHPLPMCEFLAGMRVINSVFPARGWFIDLGCGIGTKLLLAHYMGWRTAGVERHADYAHAAQTLVPEADVRVADVRGVVDLMKFDVVYAYGPLRDLFAPMRELARSWVDVMHRDALLFAAGFDPVDERLAGLGSGVWKVT